MTGRRTWICYFADPPPEGCGDLAALLGGKGASLKEMTRAQLHVPPGFTISTECCRQYFELGRQWPDGLRDELRDNLRRLERDTGRTYARGPSPLLVSVRSGAARSMPGMMDTLLNCGLHPGLADDVGDSEEFWTLYLQFIVAFARTAAGLPPESFVEAQVDPHAAPGRQVAEAYIAFYRSRTGRDFPTDPQDLLTGCINAVFDSWLSERAAAYRKRHDIRGLAGTAVNVQAMFPSEISGIVFTQDPLFIKSPSAGRMIIESSYGLGESVVSGDVTPDRFVVDRGDFARIQAELGHKAAGVWALGGLRRHDPAAASLTPPQIAELCDLAMRIEGYFGHPVDVEWGWADGRFALLQARAIRGLDAAAQVETARQEEIARLRAACDGRRKVWVIHNLAETLQYPKPLTWDIVGAFMTGSGGFGRMYRILGYRPSDRICREGFLTLICGRVYADPDRLAELFWDAMPMTYDLEGLLADKALLDRAATKFDPNRATGRFLLRLPGTVWAMIRTARNMGRFGRQAKARFERVLPVYLQYVQEKRSQDLSGLTDAAVIAELRARCEKVLNEFGPESLLPGFFGGLALDRLEAILGQLMGKAAGEELAGMLTRGLDGDTTFEQDDLLYQVAAGQARMEQFLDRFGHRCIGEMEISEPRWREDPEYLHRIAGQLRKAPRTPHEVHRQAAGTRQAAQAALPDTLRQWGGTCLRERIEQDLAEAQALLPYRETGKHYLMMGYELIRQATEELARRWDLGGGAYFLRLDELEQFTRDRARLEQAIEARRTRWQALQRLQPSEVVDSEKLDALGLVAEAAAVAADRMQGTCIAPGVATGPARIVFDPRTAGELGTDYILVCPSTDPGWTPLFLAARGLIVERGGVLSHGAIVARDFGIPAVVLPGATRFLASGQRICVNGNDGSVSIVAAAERSQQAEPGEPSERSDAHA